MQPETSLLSSIEAAVKQFMIDTGRAGGAWVRNAEQFVAEMKPLAVQYAGAAAAGDRVAASNLGFLADMAILRASRLADNLLWEEKQRLAETVKRIVGAFIAAGLNALAPGLGTVAGQVVGAVGEPAVTPAAPGTLAATFSLAGVVERASDAIPPDDVSPLPVLEPPDDGPVDPSPAAAS